MTTSSIPISDRPESGAPRGRLAAAIEVLRTDTRLAWAPLVGVVALAFALSSWHLSAVGLGNTYYAAAVRSMTQSWGNFFFGAFDPGGMITVDKPPVFLWVGAASARIFGFSSWSILLPSAIAGAATVGLLWIIVRRTFGTFAATTAALTLALTPITVAVDRLNLPEPFFILALVGAAGAIVRSLEESRGYRWAALASVLVGVAFNTKMLAAWIPGPAFVLALIVGASWPWRATWRPMLGRIAVLGVATLLVSASWMVITDNIVPASARPYVGGSTDNTVFNLAFGYNGFGRVERQGFGGGQRGNAPATRPGAGVAPGAPGTRGANPAPGTGTARDGRNGFGGAPNGVLPNGAAPNGAGPGARPGGGAPTPGQTAPRGPAIPGVPGGAGVPGGLGAFPGVGAAGGFPGFGGPGAPGAANGPGGIIAGQPGALRMIDAANGPQIAWLLSFALLSSLLALWMWRADRLRRGSVAMWIGWVVLYAGVFSFAQGIYHSYYTSALAPGIAALTGIGALATVEAVRRDRRWLIASVVLVIAGLALQFHLEGRVATYYGWLRPWAIGVAVVGLLLMGASALRHLSSRLHVPWLDLSPKLGMAMIVAALLLIPAGWSIGEAANTSLNTTLLQAGPRAGAAGRTFGSQAFDDGTNQLATWLQAHAGGETWDLAVTSAQNASTMIARNGLSVMAMGGFSGNDPAMTVAQFADLVQLGEVRYVLANGRGGPGGVGPFAPPTAPTTARGATSAPNAATFARPGASSVMAAVQQACAPVADATLPAQYRNALYDCDGRGDALAALVAAR